MIYLDNASTTRPHANIVKKVEEISAEIYGNPSSTHSVGRKSRRVLDDAREMISTSLKTNPKKLIFTSTATEANNTVINSLANNSAIKKILTTKIEHESITKPIERIEKEIKYIPVDEFGVLDLDYLKKELNTESAVVLTLVNNELGTIQPFEEIINSIRQKGGILAIDCVQAVGKIDISAPAKYSDFMTISSHKIHGPKGAAAILCKDRDSISPYILGGEQEFNRRAGTENISATYGFAMAVEHSMNNLARNTEHFAQLKSIFLNELKKLDVTVRINTKHDHSVFNIVNISIPGFDSEKIQIYLDQSGVCVSGGSACSSQSIIRSHVMENLPLPLEIRTSAVRFSFSVFNTQDEIRESVTKLAGLLK